MIHRRLCHFRSLSTLSVPTSLTHLLQCNKDIHKLSLLGRVTEARQMFDTMPRRDSGSWNTMISGYIQNGLLNKAQELFDSFQGKNVRTWTILLSGYARHGRAHEAKAVFESMPERNVVSWNAMITAYAQNGLLRSARDVFIKTMHYHINLLIVHCLVQQKQSSNDTAKRNEKNAIIQI